MNKEFYLIQKRDPKVLIWFYGISTIVGYLIPNPFYTFKQFYFKQFSLA